MSGDAGSRSLLQKKPPSFQLRKPDVKSTEEMKQRMEVQGSHRALLCRRQLKKQVASYPTVVIDLESSRKKVSFDQQPDTERKMKKEKPSMVITLPMKTEKKATKATQTDFRDSETQTLPWKHEIESGGKILAEFLALDWFNLEKNFPPGVEEVTLIEQTRQKLAWENVIERLRGKENESRRKALVLGLTANELAFRERKKDRENLERLEMSIREMREMRKAFEEKLWTRLKRSYSCQRRENLSKITYWNHQVTRKIRKAKSARERQRGKPDIISMHEDRGSDLYAPKLRDGVKPSLWHEVIDIRCRYLKRFHGLEILEKHMAAELDPEYSSTGCFESKNKKFHMSWKKFVEKVEEPKEKKLANLSLKIAVPAPTPEPATAGRTRLPSDSEESQHSPTFPRQKNQSSSKRKLNLLLR